MKRTMEIALGIAGGANRQEGGVEIVWDRGQLQSAPSIDGPWTDITFDDTCRLFLRSSSPAEFFRVKPMAEDESPTETQQSTPSKTPPGKHRTFCFEIRMEGGAQRNRASHARVGICA